MPGVGWQAASKDCVASSCGPELQRVEAVRFMPGGAGRHDE